MNRRQRFRRYYQTDRYKGFYKVDERFNGLSKMTFLAFSNGKKKIYASGMFTEDAMFKAFNAIDQFYAQKRRNSRFLVEA
ncbi:MAG: hypothetical protein U5J63_01895 [Fodinibius sp.]|nr:hypothetical protein [Fodinibius sp.]